MIKRIEIRSRPRRFTRIELLAVAAIIGVIIQQASNLPSSDIREASSLCKPEGLTRGSHNGARVQIHAHESGKAGHIHSHGR